MLKKAIIVANQDPILQGISKDINHIKNFLTSNIGGAWDNNEIDICINPTLTSLQSKLKLEKSKNYDYMMVFFTGHGGHKREETYVQINDSNELIAQSELEKLCNKQINIYDCCRSEIMDLNESIISMESYTTLSNQDMMSRATIKELYENRIKLAKPQQLILYSCSLNEVSYDTSNGAVYLSSLLEDAKNFDHNQYDDRFKLALECHNNATLVVKKRGQDQSPDYQCPKFLDIKDHLVLSINPVKNRF